MKQKIVEKYKKISVSKTKSSGSIVNKKCKDTYENEQKKLKHIRNDNIKKEVAKLNAEWESVKRKLNIKKKLTVYAEIKRCALESCERGHNGRLLHDKDGHCCSCCAARIKTRRRRIKTRRRRIKTRRRMKIRRRRMTTRRRKMTRKRRMTRKRKMTTRRRRMMIRKRKMTTRKRKMTTRKRRRKKRKPKRKRKKGKRKPKKKRKKERRKPKKKRKRRKRRPKKKRKRRKRRPKRKNKNENRKNVVKEMLSVLRKRKNRKTEKHSLLKMKISLTTGTINTTRLEGRQSSQNTGSGISRELPKTELSTASATSTVTTPRT